MYKKNDIWLTLLGGGYSERVITRVGQHCIRVKEVEHPRRELWVPLEVWKKHTVERLGRFRVINLGFFTINLFVHD